MGTPRVPSEQLFGNFCCLLKHEAPQNSLASHSTMKAPGTLPKAVL